MNSSNIIDNIMAHGSIETIEWPVWVNLHLIQLTADNKKVRLTRNYGVGWKK